MNYKDRKAAVKRKCARTVSIILIVLVCCFLYKPGYQENETAVPDKTVATETMTVPSTVEQTKANTTVEATVQPEVPAEQQPYSLSEVLLRSGYSFDFLQWLSCRELVVVSASGSSADIYLYECNNGVWVEDTDLSCSGFVGSEGVVADMSEDISGTPSGLYPIGSAFYINDEPDTGLEMFKVTNDTYWVDDPSSKYYNQKVESTDDMDWNSAEHMIDYNAYMYGFVVNYNMPAVYNAGSAIFFHIGSSPTAGCITTSQDMVLSYLSKLKSTENPYILIE